MVLITELNLETGKRILYGFLGIFLFALSIMVLRESIATLTPVLESYLQGMATSPLRALGFGWLASYIIMSGSPIAALGLVLLHQGILTPLSALMVIQGSRLGAAFILVVIGIVEYLRGKGELVDSTSIAFLTFLLTYLIFVPGLFVSLIIFSSPVFSFLTVFPSGSLSFVHSSFLPLTSTLLEALGSPLSFLAGLALLYLGLSVFDRAFHSLKMREAKSSWINYLMRRPAFSFLFGSLLTVVGQSVSLSLGIIVPLYLKGYMQRRDLIPYILGANLTTLGDTFIASLLLANPTATGVVLTVFLGNLTLTLAVLTVYSRFRSFVIRSMNFLLANKKALAVFAGGILVLPLILLLV